MGTQHNALACTGPQSTPGGGGKQRKDKGARHTTELSFRRKRSDRVRARREAGGARNTKTHYKKVEKKRPGFGLTAIELGAPLAPNQASNSIQKQKNKNSRHHHTGRHHLRRGVRGKRKPQNSHMSAQAHHLSGPVRKLLSPCTALMRFERRQPGRART